MKCKSIAIATLCVALASTASAQFCDEEIGGGGTPNFIARFTGKCRVGNSNIFQTGNAVGVNTTNPQATLDVESTGNIGIVGSTSDVNGVGIIGYSISHVGVLGEVTELTPSGVPNVGVLGQTDKTSGLTEGVSGLVYSPDGTAGVFRNRGGGDLLAGEGPIEGPHLFRIDGTGRVFANGGFQPDGADFAESMAVAGDHSKYGAGDLLVIDPTANRRVTLAQQPYSTLVAGIYSTKPGMLGTTRKVDESVPQNEIPLAVVGIVPCKATAENGSIQTGDLLVASSTPGHAMKGTDRSKMLGAVVGKALEPLPKGTGVIQVLVTLQ